VAAELYGIVIPVIVASPTTLGTIRTGEEISLVP
jgi:hypothetical protein